MPVTLERVYEDLMVIKRDIRRIMEYLEENELEIADEIKQQIAESRKRPLSDLIPHKEVEKEFL